VGVTVGTVLGVLVVAVVSFLVWRQYRLRTPTPKALEEDKTSPPYTASYISSDPIYEPTRAPSMRERPDRFSDTHTPAGTPLTGTPASCLTSLSLNSMRLAQLSGAEKHTNAPSSLIGTSIRDDESEAPFGVPPPEYEMPRY